VIGWLLGWLVVSLKCKDRTKTQTPVHGNLAINVPAYATFAFSLFARCSSFLFAAAAAADCVRSASFSARAPAFQASHACYMRQPQPYNVSLCWKHPAGEPMLSE
jgi:hypothetical protein